MNKESVNHVGTKLDLTTPKEYSHRNLVKLPPVLFGFKTTAAAARIRVGRIIRLNFHFAKFVNDGLCLYSKPLIIKNNPIFQGIR